ncbi:MAG: hypothetical protein U5L96_01145 [Owenweeksia sp.]|nr:hypothetical protein [Owenweeksia sp.]
MKRALFSIICLTTFLFIGLNESKASHTAGGEITYEIISVTPPVFPITIVFT